MSATQVDLSLAKPGDVCHWRGGGSAPFEEWDGKEWFVVGGIKHHRNGRCACSNDKCGYNIVRVTRDGKVITPAPAYPNAGPGCDLGRYRTGEVPQVGDLVTAHGEDIGTHDPGCKFDDPQEVKRLSFRRVAFAVTDILGAFAARFDLLSRAPAFPNAGLGQFREDLINAAEFVDNAGANELAGRLRAWAETEPAPAKPAEEVGEHDAAELYRDANGEPDGPHSTLPDAPAAVIQGPGKYRNELLNATADVTPGRARGLVSEVAGKGSDGRWYGDGPSGPDSWTDNGRSTRFPHDGHNITGPYVEPPPKPVLTIEEKAVAVMRSLAAAWTKHKIATERSNASRPGENATQAEIEVHRQRWRERDEAGREMYRIAERAAKEASEMFANAEPPRVQPAAE